MARTSSNMLPLGTVAPDFELIDTISNQLLPLKALKSDIATVIIFMCNHCPFVTHIIRELTHIAKLYQAKGIAFIGISSNDVTRYPDDSPEKMKEFAMTHELSFPYLYDETQAIAKAYQAACTPDFYVFNKELMCIYRGRFDDASPANNIPVTGKDLRAALENVLAGQSVAVIQQPSVGCSIKWK